MLRETANGCRTRWQHTLPGLLGLGCGLLTGVLLRHARNVSVAAVPPLPHGARTRSGALNSLPIAHPTTVLAAAPRDPNPLSGTAGMIAHPSAALAVFDRPGGRTFARLPTTVAGRPTWLAVIAQQAGWVQVLLPVQPAGSTGWLDATRVTLAMSRHEVRILLSARRAQLVFAGWITHSWPITCGTPQTPTPAGRTFLLGVVHDSRRRPDPIVLPLAAPSRHTGCGLAAVIAMHTGPPHAGCIAVPPDALPVLARIPLGSLVRITP